MITDVPCPCCAGRKGTNGSAWVNLCDKCAYYFNRLRACPHEYRSGTCAR